MVNLFEEMLKAKVEEKELTYQTMKAFIRIASAMEKKNQIEMFKLGLIDIIE
jgi:hypothetical protein